MGPWQALRQSKLLSCSQNLKGQRRTSSFTWATPLVIRPSSQQLRGPGRSRDVPRMDHGRRCAPQPCDRSRDWDLHFGSKGKGAMRCRHGARAENPHWLCGFRKTQARTNWPLGVRGNDNGASGLGRFWTSNRLGSSSGSSIDVSRSRWKGTIQWLWRRPEGGRDQADQ